jgi:transcriptional regulator with XRE-family HTH domain
LDAFDRTEIDSRFQNQRAVSRRLGVHHNTVLNWLSGRTDPPLSMVVAMAKIFDVDLRNLAKYLLEKQAGSNQKKRKASIV